MVVLERVKKRGWTCILSVLKRKTLEVPLSRRSTSKVTGSHTSLTDRAIGGPHFWTGPRTKPLGETDLTSVAKLSSPSERVLCTCVDRGERSRPLRRCGHSEHQPERKPQLPVVLHRELLEGGTHDAMQQGRRARDGRQAQLSPCEAQRLHDSVVEHHRCHLPPRPDSQLAELVGHCHGRYAPWAIIVASFELHVPQPTPGRAVGALHSTFSPSTSPNTQRPMPEQRKPVRRLLRTDRHKAPSQSGRLGSVTSYMDTYRTHAAWHAATSTRNTPPRIGRVARWTSTVRRSGPGPPKIHPRTESERTVRLLVNIPPLQLIRGAVGEHLHATCLFS
jgi:hypothetical protein